MEKLLTNHVLPVLLGLIVGNWGGRAHWRSDSMPGNERSEVAFSILPGVTQSPRSSLLKKASSPLLRRCADLDQLLRGGNEEAAFRYLLSRRVIGWLDTRPEVGALIQWLCETHPHKAQEIYLLASRREPRLAQALLETMVATDLKEGMAWWNASGPAAQKSLIKSMTIALCANDSLERAREWIEAFPETALRDRAWRAYYGAWATQNSHEARQDLLANGKVREGERDDVERQIRSAVFAKDPARVVAAHPDAPRRLDFGQERAPGWYAEFLTAFDRDLGASLTWLQKAGADPWSLHMSESPLADVSVADMRDLLRGETWDAEWRQSIIQYWSSQIPSTTFASLIEAMDQPDSLADFQGALRTIGNRWMDENPAAAVAWMTEHHADPEAAELVINILEHGGAVMESVMALWPEGAVKAKAEQVLAEAELERMDPLELASWLVGRPTQLDSARGLLEDGTEWLPDAMLESFLDQEPSEVMEEGAVAVLETWLGRDRAGAAARVAELAPGPVRDRLIEILSPDHEGRNE